jgi:hypothetical protein
MEWEIGYECVRGADGLPIKKWIFNFKLVVSLRLSPRGALRSLLDTGLAVE